MVHSIMSTLKLTSPLKLFLRQVVASTPRNVLLEVYIKDRQFSGKILMARNLMNGGQ